MRLTIERRIEAGHRLLNYDGACAHPHGHSYRILLSFDGQVGPLGFVHDFKEVKDVFRLVIERYLDHSFLVHRDDPLGPELAGRGFRVLAFNRNPTAENIATWIYSSMFGWFDDHGSYLEDVEVWETATASATASVYDRTLEMDAYGI